MSKYQDLPKKITAPLLRQLKEQGVPIAMLTAYDYTMARLVDQAGIDVILVGDSAANVMAGHSTTLPITLDQMIYHGACVVRGVKRAMVVVDMPFGSYQVNRDQAVASAIRIMQETGADAVKLEGGSPAYNAIEGIIEAGIPVVGHLGLTPQSVHQLGGFSLQGKHDDSASRIIEEALELERLGCAAVVVEKIPSSLGKAIASRLKIPVIGIGAGVMVDGQVLVMQDMLGLDDDFSPKFLRRFASLKDNVIEATQSYISEVKKRGFPSENESY